MPRALTSDELALLRSDMQGTKLYLAVFKPNVIYTATLSVVPASNDRVYQISFGSGSGTLGNVKPGMTLYVGTSAGAYNLGMCRIRKNPISGTFYIGLTSEINWAVGGTIHLTVVDEFDLWAKHAINSDGIDYMDVDVTYSDQHANFNPVPIMGSHAVLWLDGDTVSVDFDGSDSWVIGSTISSYAWVAPGASASSGMSTATPTITYNSVGFYRVYLTVGAANGKSTMGVRYVFVYDRGENMPATVFQLAQCVGDYDTGGWMFDMAMETEASLSEIRDRSLVVLFAEDWHGNVKQSIGPLEGRENIVCMGRVVGESLRWDRESGLVHFTVQGLHHWLNKIKAFPVELSFVGAATNWSEMPALTVDRALWHILYWHSTVIETMDFYPTEDARYTPTAKTIASMIWGQLADLGFSKIFASPGVSRFGQLFVEIDPQMVPEASRTWPTLMEITDGDFQESIDFQRMVVNDVSYIALNAEEVNSAGTPATRYSLWPGHVPRRYGDAELLDRLLCASQTQANQMCGLAGGWRINEYPDVPVIFAQNNRMLDLFPRQFCSISVAAEDTPRGVTAEMNLIPRRIAFYFDGEIGYMHPEVNFEAETFEQPTVNGDVPDMEDVDFSIPQIPDLPDLPDIDLSLPTGGWPGSNPTVSGPPKVLVHDPTIGLLYSDNFNTASPTWRTINAGLTQRQYQHINRIVLCPSGALYVAYVTTYNGTTDRECFVARAPYVGGTFTVLEDHNSVAAKLGTPVSNVAIVAINCNKLASEQVMYILGNFNTGNGKIVYGYASTWTVSSAALSCNGITGSISYGNGSWVLTAQSGSGAATWWRISTTGSIIASGTVTGALAGTFVFHLRASSTGITYHFPATDSNLIRGEDNCASFVTGIGDSLLSALPAGYEIDPTGQIQMSTTGTSGRRKSSDGGYTWTDIGALPFVGSHWQFAWAGGSGLSTSRWIAAYSYLYYSENFGGAWADKRGNILDLAPLMTLNIVQVVEY